jgi:hypothetical protein
MKKVCTLVVGGPTATLCGFLIAASPAAAQDSHYWDREYGTTSELLGGTVVGSVRDLSATFYNPGALGLAKDPKFILSLETLELSQVTLPRAVGDTLNLAQTSLAAGPGILAGTFNGPAAKNRWAFSVITRQNFDMNLRRRTSDPFDPAPTEPVTAQFINRGQQLTEIWAGVTWARRLGSALGLGATGYLATRSQSADALYTAESFGPLADQASAINLRSEYSYLHFRLLAKVGLAWETGGWRLGTSITTPSVGLWGRGELGGNESVVNVDVDGDSIPDNLLSDSFQNTAPTYKSAPSVAVGASYGPGRTRIHGTIEWFGGIDTYSVLQGDPFQSQTTGEILVPAVRDELRSVVNGGLGVEHRFSETVAGYASVTLDQAAKVRTTGRSNSFTTWDIIHLRGGSTFPVLGANVALGLGVSFGSSVVPSLVDIADPQVPEPPESLDQEVKYWRLKLIFGFTTGN